MCTQGSSGPSPDPGGGERCRRGVGRRRGLWDPRRAILGKHLGVLALLRARPLCQPAMPSGSRCPCWAPIPCPPSASGLPPHLGTIAVLPRPAPQTGLHQAPQNVFFTSGKALCRRGEGPGRFPGRFLYSIFLAVLCPCVLRGCDPASQGLVCLSPSPTCACAPVYPRRPPPASPPAPGIPPTCSPCSLGRPRGGSQPG